MLEDKYQQVFFEYTKSTELALLGRICLDHNMDLSTFIAWMNADPIRVAKMKEVQETRAAQMEKAK